MEIPRRPDVILVSRSIILNDNAEMLLVQRSAYDNNAPGKWEFPGGKTDRGSTLEEARQREVAEETGLMTANLSPLVYPDSYIIKDGKYAGALYIALIGVARAVSKDIRLSEEHCDYAWASHGQALGYDLTNVSQRALTVFRKRLLKDVIKL